MMTDLLRRHERVSVGANSVEGHIAKIEEAGVAHHDIEAIREHHEEAEVYSDAE
ncbi:unannotated protein [freshwater metagenome]|uniref:Unannotated protein n=1 Tax=freshwater metagenome TaxID=449393 RepID=A0A6J7SQM4_9ZZZZ